MTGEFVTWVFRRVLCLESVIPPTVIIVNFIFPPLPVNPARVNSSRTRRLLWNNYLHDYFTVMFMHPLGGDINLRYYRYSLNTTYYGFARTWLVTVKE